jgi:hypothetical protein
MKKLKRALTAVALLSAALSITALGGPGHDHGQGHSHGHSAAHNHGHAHARDIVIPETLSGVVAAVNEWHAKLSEAITAKNDHDAHDAEETLQALLKAVPGKAGSLPDEARKRTSGQARNLARAYVAVHHAADSADWTSAESAMKRATATLELLTATPAE